MKEKIAFVCQRYGLEVNGGAELECKQLAEHLCGLYDVSVYTTCAIDYVTWKNEYNPGVEQINGVHVHRFISDEERAKNFPELCSNVLSNYKHTDEEELKWINAQGPLCPALIEALYKERQNYKVIFFMTYLYYPTAVGIQKNFNNSILIPTAHDEAPIYLRYYDKVFASAKAYLWQIEEEKVFAEERFPFIRGKRGTIAGVGVEIPDMAGDELPKELKALEYIVYAGRIDESKGCKEMFDFFLRYKKSHKNELKLVLMGKTVMAVPKHTDIINLGFVSDKVKFSVMKEAKMLVLFSKYESLSMVVLESMAVGRPVLVNGCCDVLKGHCIRSNAGLYFENYEEFEATLEYLREHKDIYTTMQENGKQYIAENYQWNVIVNRLRALIESV